MHHLIAFRPAFVLLLLCAGGCTGFGHGDIETGAPTLSVALTVDAPTYARNAAVIASVTITNAGEKPASIALPGRETMEFNLFTKDSPDPFHVEFVSSPLELSEFQLVEPGETIKRPFVLPLAARAAGTFRLIAVYHPELEDSIVGGTPVASDAAPFEVDGPPVFDRDSNGVISEADAIRVAQSFFARPTKSSSARFLIDENRLGVWLVTVELAQPDAKGRTTRACRVNPYHGKVQKEESPNLKTAPPTPPPAES